MEPAAGRCQRWLAEVEVLLGRDPDGDQRVDGYSMESFHAIFEAGKTPLQASERVVGAVFITADGVVYRLQEVGLSIADRYLERCRVHASGGNSTSFLIPDDARLVWSPLSANTYR